LLKNCFIDDVDEFNRLNFWTAEKAIISTPSDVEVSLSIQFPMGGRM
jgi:hypothetical protein